MGNVFLFIAVREAQTALEAAEFVMRKLQSFAGIDNQVYPMSRILVEDGKTTVASGVVIETPDHSEDVESLLRFLKKLFADETALCLHPEQGSQTRLFQVPVKGDKISLERVTEEVVGNCSKIAAEGGLIEAMIYQPTSEQILICGHNERAHDEWRAWVFALSRVDFAASANFASAKYSKVAIG